MFPRIPSLSKNQWLLLAAVCAMVVLFVLTTTDVYHKHRREYNIPMKTNLSWDWNFSDNIRISLMKMTEKKAEMQTTISNRISGNSNENSSRNVENEKLILLYNPKHWELLMKKSFSNIWSNCPCKCKLTNNRTEYNKSDAVVFVIDLMPRVSTIPEKRSGQVWIFSQFESPHYLANEIHKQIMRRDVMKRFDRKVNWTMSYRRDSDIVFVHGDYSVKSEKTRKGILFGKIHDVYSKKTKTAAWFVSHCTTLSKREKFVALMKKYLKIDQFGGCTHRNLPNCPHDRPNAIRDAWGLNSSSARPRSCFSILDEKYKFYLSFENSLCRDYLTEKSLHHVVQHDVIPIMRTGANHSLFNPPHSYIDTNQFKTVANLTAYLKNIENNEEEIFRYFDWKRHYKSEYPIKNWQASMCEICRRLHSPGEHTRLYNDLFRWIMTPNDEDACTFPKDLG